MHHIEEGVAIDGRRQRAFRVDGGETAAVCESIFADALHRAGQVDGGEASGVLESRDTDADDIVGDDRVLAARDQLVDVRLDNGVAAATRVVDGILLIDLNGPDAGAREGVALNAGHRGGQVDVFKVVTVAESEGADGGDRWRQDDLGEAASAESIVTDRGHAGRDDDALQA